MRSQDGERQAGAERTPNIVVIMTDQFSAQALSCAGNPDLSTPAIDALARSGTRFTHASCTAPLCVPSRASMLTGKYPSQLGVNDNVLRVPDSFPPQTMGRIFADAGYCCAYAGKWHVPGIVHEGEPATGARGLTSGFTRIHDGAHHGLADACTRYLADPDRAEQPFLLVASFNEPHGICEWARGQSPPSGEIEDVDWRELPLLPPNFRASTEEPEALRLIHSRALTVHPTGGWDEEQWRRYRYAYYRLCERVDAEIGRVLAALEQTGHRENTVIVFTADHGDMQGAHGWNQKKVLYEEAVSVPFILSPPAPTQPGTTREELVSTGIDLLPTLCDYAGIEAEPSGPGMSLRGFVDPLVELPERREYVVTETEWTFPGILPPPQPDRLVGRLVRTAGYAYLCHSWGNHREQLFDLRADPGQMLNLATSGARQRVLEEHRMMLRTHCAQVHDTFAQYVPGPGVPPR